MGVASLVSVKQAFLCSANTFSVLRVRWGDLKVWEHLSGDHNVFAVRSLR